MKKIIKKIVYVGGALALLCVVLMLVCNQLVVNNAKGKVYSDIDSINYNKVGLLLGTTPRARLTGVTNYFFIYRMDAAEQLYKAGKIEKILISGDEDSLDGINEPECMRDSLVVRGVPASAIILDGKGYRTICSVVNANKVYGLKSFTIISQEFHNERAIYQAEHLGLDVKSIQAYNAKTPKSRRAYLTTIREYFARVKLFWDIITYKETDYYNSEMLNGLEVSLSLPKDTIYSFFGKPIIFNDSIYKQLSTIASQDKMLSYKDSIINIGDISWRVNLTLKSKSMWKSTPMIPSIVLFTSVQPEDPKMRKVIDYLNAIYGKPYDIDVDDYKFMWSSSDDSTDIVKPGSTLVHLRRVHSEEGGSFLNFVDSYYWGRYR